MNTVFRCATQHDPTPGQVRTKCLRCKAWCWGLAQAVFEGAVCEVCTAEYLETP